MFKLIPEKRIFVCDCCKRTEDKHVSMRRSMKANLHMNRSALDWQGNAVGDGSYRYDLCDECEILVTTSFRNIVKSQEEKYSEMQKLSK